MDRKLFLSYVQNMQQNNPDMIGFQNSITKNSWQKPRSIVEMNGGGSVNQGDFDVRDRMREPARRADEEGLKAIRSDLKDIAAPSDPMAALRAMPPLLRSYLGIGGWVSDHVVQDFELGTIHVFTGVEVSRIPPQRAQALRALAGQIDLS